MFDRRGNEREREISRAAAMFVLMSFQKHDAFCLLLVLLRPPRGGAGGDDPHPVRKRPIKRGKCTTAEDLKYQQGRR